MRQLKVFTPSPHDTTQQKVYKKIVFLISVGRNAIVVLVCCGIAYGVREWEPFKITGYIVPGLPTPSVPHFSLTCNNGTEYYSFGKLLGMFGSGVFIVPMIAILENIAIASAFAGGKAIDATQVQ